MYKRKFTDRDIKFAEFLNTKEALKKIRNIQTIINSKNIIEENNEEYKIWL
jgi:hypothetical protein